LITTPRIPRPFLGVLLVSAVVLSAPPARADDTPRVFPLVPTSPLSPELADAPSVLTDALADLIDGVTTERSLADFGKKLRCDVEMSTCLDAVARSLVTSRLVYGTFAAMPGGKIKVKLVRFDSAKAGSEMYQRAFTLNAQTPKRLGKQLARSAAAMFDRQPPPDEVVRPASLGKVEKEEPVVVTEETPEPGPKPVEPASPSDDGPAHGRITGSTWGILGGGALGVAVGAGFLISARGLAAELEQAPRATETDFRRLTAIERAGRIRMEVGGTLLVAGGAALAVGAVRAYLQHSRGKPESTERSIALVPMAGGGAAIVFAGGLR
jgi:hypothetical protein